MALKLFKFSEVLIWQGKAFHIFGPYLVGVFFPEVAWLGFEFPGWAYIFHKLSVCIFKFKSVIQEGRMA